MSTRIILASLIALSFSSCGGTNDNNQAQGYALNQNGPGPGPAARLCPPFTARQWNHLVARRCNAVNSNERARWCVWGAAEFRDRNRQLLQGPGCTIAVRETHWAPGDHWRQQQFFQVNEAVLQSIFDRFGGMATPSWPVNPGQPGGPWQPGEGEEPGNPDGHPGHPPGSDFPR